MKQHKYKIKDRFKVNRSFHSSLRQGEVIEIAEIYENRDNYYEIAIHSNEDNKFSLAEMASNDNIIDYWIDNNIISYLNPEDEVQFEITDDMHIDGLSFKKGDLILRLSPAGGDESYSCYIIRSDRNSISKREVNRAMFDLMLNYRPDLFKRKK